MNREIPSFHAAALILGGAALTSKLLGLFRDRLLAARFGAGDTLDVYYAAFIIPDVLYTFFLIGAASAAVLPVFLEYERRGPSEAESFISKILTAFSAIGAVIVAGGIIFAPWLVSAIVPGFGSEKLAPAVMLTRLMMANALFLGIAGILSSVMQARHRFLVFALPPIVYNLGIIIGIVAFVPFFGVSGLAYGVILGGIGQVLIQLPTLAAMRFHLRLEFRPSDPGLVRVMRISLPRVAALAMSQLTIVALTALASFFAVGSVSVFKLASNLLYVPIGVFGVSWALAAFPKLSGATLEGQGEEFRKHLLLGMRSILFWTLPAAALFIVLRAHLIRVILGSGVFDWADTRLVAAVLAILAFAVVSESLLPLVLRAFYALGRTREPLMWDIIGSLLTIGFALGFSFWFAVSPRVLATLATILRIGDLESPRILAVALAFTFGSLLNISLLLMVLHRVVVKRLGIVVRLELGAILPMLVAALLAGLAAYATLQPFPALVHTNTFFGILLQGVVAGAAGLAVYGAVLAWQRNPEILGMVSSIRGRLLSPARTPAVFDTEKLDGDAGR